MTDICRHGILYTHPPRYTHTEIGTDTDARKHACTYMHTRQELMLINNNTKNVWLKSDNIDLIKEKMLAEREVFCGILSRVH